MLTAMAVVVATDSGQLIPGAIGKLESRSGVYQLLVGISNELGYMVFNNVPLPFSGKLQLSGAVQYYEADFDVNAESVTLRVGSSPSSPQDIHLPGAVPFV